MTKEILLELAGINMKVTELIKDHDNKVTPEVMSTLVSLKMNILQGVQALNNFSRLTAEPPKGV